jgi:hypothetical protein
MSDVLIRDVPDALPAIDARAGWLAGWGYRVWSICIGALLRSRIGGRADAHGALSQIAWASSANAAATRS